jgi:hypothetical protein
MPVISGLDEPVGVVEVEEVELAERSAKPLEGGVVNTSAQRI